jgi:hypothetical protein
MSSEHHEKNGSPEGPLATRAVDAAGRLIPISDEERRRRLPLELTSLQAAWDIPADETDSDEIWDEVLRNLGVDPATGRGATAGLARLDRLHPGVAYLPISDAVLELAGELWAAVRRAGRPTAPDAGLNGDAILAATAILESRSSGVVIVATTNVAHLARFHGVDARDWWTIR